MITEDLIKSLGVTESTLVDGYGDAYNCWYVKGKLQSYFIDRRTNKVYTARFDYISITQPPFGHQLIDVLAIIMALKNDDVMVTFIPTLNPKHK